jgi:C-terminal processing protease CtpA/Prc
MNPAIAEAVEILRRESYYAFRVDWDAVLAADSLATALHLAFAGLADRHTHVLGPHSTASATASLPTGRTLPGNIGYLRLPAIRTQRDDPASLAYVHAAHAAMAVPANGWIVDVRGNTGGTVHPMLAAAGPLLGADTFLSYRRRTGWGARFRFHDGTLHNHDRPELTVPGMADRSDLPVALLHDARTASSGEGVVVAFRGHARTFGAPTAGVPTGTVLHRLSSGARLAITVSVSVDRTGRHYEAPIPPDEPAADPQMAALAWLATAAGVA